MSAPRDQRRKQKAGAAAAKKCFAAADAIQSYISACNESRDGSEVTRTDDQRLLFLRDLRDYALFLERRYT